MEPSPKLSELSSATLDKIAFIHQRTKSDRKSRIRAKLRVLSAFKQEGVRHVESRGKAAREAFEAHQKAVFESGLCKLHHGGGMWHHDDFMKGMEGSRAAASKKGAAGRGKIGGSGKKEKDEGLTEAERDALRSVPEDPNMATAFLRKYPLRLEDATEEIRADSGIAMLCVNADWHAFKYLSEELRDDPRLVELALRADWRAIKYVGERSRDDPGIMMLVVSQCGEALKYASNRVRDHRDVVLMAVSDQGDSLEHASERLQADPEVVRLAIREEPFAFNFAHHVFREDRTLVMDAVSFKGWSLALACEGLRDDREVVLAAVRQHGGALQFASDRLRDDREVVLEACRESFKAMKHASERLLEDPKVQAAGRPPKKSRDRFGTRGSSIDR